MDEEMQQDPPQQGGVGDAEVAMGTDKAPTAAAPEDTPRDGEEEVVVEKMIEGSGDDEEEREGEEWTALGSDDYGEYEDDSGQEFTEDGGHGARVWGPGPWDQQHTEQGDYEEEEEEDNEEEGAEHAERALPMGSQIPPLPDGAKRKRVPCTRILQ